MAAKKTAKKAPKTTKKPDPAEPTEAPNGQIQADFTFRNATKNKYRFDEIDEGDGVAVGSLYVVKEFLGDDPPAKISITIEVA